MIRWTAFVLVFSLAAASDPSIDPKPLPFRSREGTPLVIEFEIPKEDRERWVRLRDFNGPVVVNGVTVIPRPGDRVTSTLALTPYLTSMKTNRVEFREPQAALPAMELLPRVFLAAASAGNGNLRMLVENTLENAANVQVEIDSVSRNAYVPPESQVEINFPAPRDPDLEIHLTKFPEAIEEGYRSRSRLSLLPPIGLRQEPKSAMVFGRACKAPSFHLLEPGAMAERRYACGDPMLAVSLLASTIKW